MKVVEQYLFPTFDNKCPCVQPHSHGGYTVNRNVRYGPHNMADTG